MTSRGTKLRADQGGSSPSGVLPRASRAQSVSRLTAPASSTDEYVEVRRQRVRQEWEEAQAAKKKEDTKNGSGSASGDTADAGSCVVS